MSLGLIFPFKKLKFLHKKTKKLSKNPFTKYRSVPTTLTDQKESENPTRRNKFQNTKNFPTVRRTLHFSLFPKYLGKTEIFFYIISATFLACVRFLQVNREKQKFYIPVQCFFVFYQNISCNCMIFEFAGLSLI